MTKKHVSHWISAASLSKRQSFVIQSSMLKKARIHVLNKSSSLTKEEDEEELFLPLLLLLVPHEEGALHQRTAREPAPDPDSMVYSWL